MALLQALQALAIDVMLPALGPIATDLGGSSGNERQLIIGIFLFGLGAGALFPGVLADRFGRRPVLFVCLAVYVVTSIACALAPNLTTLLVLRGVQALFSAGLGVLPAAIIRDRYEGDRMARLQSLVAVIFMTVPMLAPTLGQWLMDWFGWRWIFGAMAVLGAAMSAWVWLRLPETLRPDDRQPIRVATIARNMASVVTTRATIGYVLASTLTLGAMWGFINSSQQLIGEAFGAGDTFAYVFGVMAGGMAVGNFMNSRIVERFGARRVSHTALLLFIALAALQTWLAAMGWHTFWTFVPVMMMQMTLLGFTGANFTSIALQPFGRTAGAAASVQSFIRTTAASLIGGMVGQAYDGTAGPLALALFVSGCLALALVLYSEHGVLFRRVYPRGTRRPEY